MNGIIPFKWDRMYAIMPYISKTEMHEIVGTQMDYSVYLYWLSDI